MPKAVHVLKNVKQIILGDWKNIIIRGIFALSIPFLSIIYFVLDKPRGIVHVLSTSVDNCIHFNKYFIIPYILWYAYVGLTLIYFMVADPQKYWRLLICMVIGVSACYTTFYFFQTTVPRPILSGNDIFTKLVKIIYSTDLPYNCFPSIHVLHTVFVTTYINGKDELNKGLKFFCNMLAVSIILSTMFLKQHFFMDVIGGAVLAYSIYFAVNGIADLRLNSSSQVVDNAKKNLHA